MIGEALFGSSPGVGVLLLGDGGVLSLSVVRALASEGIRDVQEFAVNYVPVEMTKHSRYVKSYKTYGKRSFTSFSNSFEDLDPHHLVDTYRSKQRLVLLPVTAEAARWMSVHKESLGLHFQLPSLPTTDCLDLVSNKWSLHRWLKANNFDSPQTVVFDANAGDFRRKVKQIGYPQILKSKSEIPFKNIFFLQDEDRLSEIEDRIKGDWEANIIQQVIPGVDRDVSLLAENGKLVAYTMQTPVVARKLRYATSIKFFDDPELLNIVSEMVEKLKWSGVAHLDFRYNPETQKYFLIDFNARYWGTLLGSVCARVNVPYLQVQQACNRDIQSTKTEPVTFLMNRDALQELYNRLFKKKKSMNGFSWKNSELRYSLLDPLPEIFRRYRNNTD